MGLNGADAAIDEVAREMAANALEGSRKAWEGVGQILRELHTLRDEVHEWMTGSGEVHGRSSLGRRAYDPDEEITATGSRVKVPLERFRAMERSLANIQKKEAAALEKERDAALKAAGAQELERRWKRRIYAIAPIVGSALAGAFELLKWLLSR